MTQDSVTVVLTMLKCMQRAHPHKWSIKKLSGQSLDCNTQFAPSVWAPLSFDSLRRDCVWLFELCVTVWVVCDRVGGWHHSLPLWDDALKKKGSIIYHRKWRKWNDSNKKTITGDQEQEGTGASHCLHHSVCQGYSYPLVASCYSTSACWPTVLSFLLEYINYLKH